jgi:hypothetical protein
MIEIDPHMLNVDPDSPIPSEGIEGDPGRVGQIEVQPRRFWLLYQLGSAVSASMQLDAGGSFPQIATDQHPKNPAPRHVSITIPGNPEPGCAGAFILGQDRRKQRQRNRWYVEFHYVDVNLTRR